MAEPTAWEYFTVSLNMAEQQGRTFNDLMTDYGHGGWELVSVSVLGQLERYHFKRRMQAAGYGHHLDRMDPEGGILGRS